MTNYLRSILIASAILILAVPINTTLFAQGYNFNIQFDAGNPGGLNTESDTATNGWVVLNVGGESANTWSANQLLPIPFFFYGVPVTSFKASLNGLITFTTASSLLPSANLNLPTAALPNQTIACFWDEFTSAPPLSSDSRLLTKLIGSTVGSRQLWIKWNLFQIGNPSLTFANFACVLEEGSNKVYIVDMNHASGNVTATIGLQNTTTNAFQFGSNFAFFFSTTSGPAFGNNDFYEFTPQLTNDAGVQAITSPSVPFGSGTTPVRVTLRNFSSATLTNAIVRWTVDGVQQPDFNWTGSIASNGSLTNVSIGTFNFVSGRTYTIRAFTLAPNGGSDINPANDTAAVGGICPLMSGSFSVGGVGAQFPTIQAALSALSCAGMESPVTLNLNAAAGPYTAFDLTNFLGQSSINTLTIDGGAGKARISSSTGSTIRLNGADFVRLRNLDIVNTAANNGFGVQLINNANDNIIEDCRITGATSTSTFNGNACILVGTAYNLAAGGNNASRLIIRRNELIGGGASIGINALNFTAADQDIQLTDNTISQPSLAGIVTFNTLRLKAYRNTLNLTGTTASGKGFNLTGDEGFDLSFNTILNSGGDGIDLNNCNIQTGSPTNRALISNNFIIANVPNTATEGLEIGGSSHIDFIHNSISLTASTSDAINYILFGSPTNNFVRIVNNSLALFNTTGAFVRVFDAGTFGTISNLTLDHNNYFVNGASLGVIRTPFGDFDAATFIGAGGFNANSRFGNPGYLNPVADLHAVTSQLSNAGNNTISTPTDIDGDPRPFLAGGTVDIGADEFNQIPNDVGIATIVSPQLNGRALTSNSYSSNQSFTIAITNYGTVSQIGIPVFLRINGSVLGPFTFAGSVAPGVTQNFTFLSGFNMQSPGVYEVSAFTGLATDGNTQNDTSAPRLLNQLANAPTVFPVIETFEATPTVLINNDSVRGLEGAPRFDYLASGFSPRLRTNAGTGFAQSSTRAITFDRFDFGLATSTAVNNLVLTLNMTPYTLSDIILLDFAYMNHNVFTDQPNNRVFIRGSDQSPWIQVFDLFSNQSAAGTYRNVTNFNVSI